MYVTGKMIGDMVDRYGQPAFMEYRFPVEEKEYRLILGSQKDGRMHDVTVYTVKEGRIVVIAKHFYPPGMYRAPSGGLIPGEPFEDGLKREIWEETGCEIALSSFLLKTKVTFFLKSDMGENVIDWNSFVFQADYLKGDFNFTDKREIREVRLARPEEFEDFSRIMRQSDIGGLHYRAALHDTVKGLLRF